MMTTEEEEEAALLLALSPSRLPARCTVGFPGDFSNRRPLALRSAPPRLKSLKGARGIAKSPGVTNLRQKWSFQKL